MIIVVTLGKWGQGCGENTRETELEKIRTRMVCLRNEGTG